MLHEKLVKYNIILASGSPRRKQLLEEMGVKFKVVPKHIEEIYPDDLSPKEVAEFLSRLKADAFTADEMDEHTLIITSDTVVTIDDEILGKPADKEEATEILKLLSGKSHDVITGVTLKTIERERTFSVSTIVVFKTLNEDEINYYIDHYKPFDKAGAYGIQEWVGHVAIESIEGSYFNVMGLPTHRLYEELLSFTS